jgi:hypothetical protein
LKVTKIPK